MPNHSIYIRADADATIGAGHVMRCLALAQEARKVGLSTGFIGHIAPGLVERLQVEGFQTFLMKENVSKADDHKNLMRIVPKSAAVVIDHYSLGPGYQRRVREDGHRLLVIDDCNHQQSYVADLLLNPNLSAQKYVYNTEAKRLLGPRYALLRSEILAYPRPLAESRLKMHNILVTLGGSDPNNYTLQVLKALKMIPQRDLCIKAVVGPAFPWTEEIKRFLAQSNINVDLHSNVDNMAEIYAWADAAVTAGGSTVYELAYFRLPAAVLCLADNQHEVIAELDRRKMALFLSDGCARFSMTQQLEHFFLDIQQSKSMAVAIGSLVDGCGTSRVLTNLLGQFP